MIAPMLTDGVSLDLLRLEVNGKLNPARKTELGQFMTPSRVAQFMAYLFAPGDWTEIRLLDAGAGIGALTAAFLDRWLADDITAQAVETTAYEIDPLLCAHLQALLSAYRLRAQQAGYALKTKIDSYDFIEDATDRILFWNTQNFTHAILNPPYKKIHSQSQHRKALRAVGIETVNLYTAFVALAIQLLADGGEMVAIIPRSFCNGPYYRPFREFMLAKTAIQHLHLFGARNQAFKDDEVLQENIIIHLVKGGVQETVTVSTSTDQTFVDYVISELPFEQIVQPDDPEHFIHIPTSEVQTALEPPSALCTSLADLGVDVSTGPVVDFRVKAYLCDEPETGTAPLLYPLHFANGHIEWPQQGIKKPNALKIAAETEKWLYPSGFYTVVKRFSSKEEKRRIVAHVVAPSDFAEAQIGFENHLNVFHQSKQGLPEALAYGLAAFLNSSQVDAFFRRFSGHTQVNATDLRQLKYPNLAVLCELGRWAKSCKKPTQAELDQKIAGLWPSKHE